MRISVIIALFLLSIAVKGWIALLQPFGLALGAAFAALNLDVDLISDLRNGTVNQIAPDNFTRAKKILDGIDPFKREELKKIFEDSGPDKHFELL